MPWNLNSADMQSLVLIVKDVPGFGTPDDRKAIIVSALGLSQRAKDAVSSLDLNGSPEAVAGRVISHLANFGKLESDEETLELFLINSVATKVELEVGEEISNIVSRSHVVSPKPRWPTLPGDLDPGIEDAPQPGEDVRQRTRERIERRLERLSSDIMRNFAEELYRKGDAALQEGKDPTPIILTILLERRRFSTISCLSKIHGKLCEGGEWDAADIVAEILEDVTPLVIDPGLANRLWNEIHIRMSVFCFVPDHHSTTIEVLMSREMGKA